MFNSTTENGQYAGTTTNYILSAGIEEGLISHGFGGNAGTLYINSFPPQGAFRCNSYFAPSAFRDGLSNTFAAGERDYDRGAAKVWYGASVEASNNDALPIHFCVGRVHRELNSVVTLHITSGDRYDSPNAPTKVGGVFASKHPGGANFVLMDGAVRFIGDNISFFQVQQAGNNLHGQITNGNYMRNPQTADPTNPTIDRLGVYQILAIKDSKRSVSLP